MNSQKSGFASQQVHAGIAHVVVVGTQWNDEPMIAPPRLARHVHDVVQDRFPVTAGHRTGLGAQTDVVLAFRGVRRGFRPGLDAVVLCAPFASPGASTAIFQGGATNERRALHFTRRRHVPQARSILAWAMVGPLFAAVTMARTPAASAP